MQGNCICELTAFLPIAETSQTKQSLTPITMTMPETGIESLAAYSDDVRHLIRLKWDTNPIDLELGLPHSRRQCTGWDRIRCHPPKGDRRGGVEFADGIHEIMPNRRTPCRPQRQVTSTRQRGGDITALCNNRSDWKVVFKDEAIIDFESERCQYYVCRADGRKTVIHVVDGPHGKYLRTGKDDTTQNNLLELPECDVPDIFLREARWSSW